jgi:DNA-binding transcriptional MerR regulator
MLEHLQLDEKPLFSTGVASTITGINPKTIINYENAGIFKIERSEKGRRLFSKKDLFKVLLTKYLINNYDLTFDGVKFVFELCRKSNSQDFNLLPFIIEEDEKEQLIEKITI